MSILTTGAVIISNRPYNASRQSHFKISWNSMLELVCYLSKYISSFQLMTNPDVPLSAANDANAT